MAKLRDWQGGSPLSAGHFQEVVDAVKEMATRGDPAFRDYATYTPVLVKITSNASGGGKYNGRILDGIMASAATGNLAMPESMTTPASDDCLCFNPAEDGSSGHSIPTPNYVGGFLVGQTTAGLRVVAMTGISVNRSMLVKVTTSAAGGGKYTGRAWTRPTADVSASGNLAAADLGTDPGADNALILNLPEIGAATHDLKNAANTAQFFFVGNLIYVNADGTYVVAINGFYNEDCT